MTSAFLPYAEQSSAPTRRRGVSRWSLCRAREASPRAPSSPASFSASRSWTKTPSRRRRRDEARRVTLFANEQPRFVPRFREKKRARRTERRSPPPRDETRFLFLPFRDENASIRRPEKNASRRLRSRRRGPRFRVPRPLEGEKSPSRPRLSPARRATAARWTASPGTHPTRH